jgi:drug/metabolite transporter (DMT)-like permease
MVSPKADTGMQNQNHSRGALLAALAAVMFACMGASIKAASAELPNEVVVFFRNLFGLAVLLPWLARSGTAVLATRRLHEHVLRTLTGLGAMYCFFYTIAHMHLAEAILLNFTAPLFVPFIALLWLGERLTREAVWAMIIGFAGVALILKPGMELFSPVALVGLASGALAAWAVVGVRRMSDTEPTTRIVFYYSTIATGVSAVPLAWSWQAPEPRLWLLLLAAGLFATAGQLLMTRGYSLGPAARIGPFTYSSVAFAALLGWMLWGEVPDPLSLGGVTLVCVAGIIALRRGPRRLGPVERM